MFIVCLSIYYIIWKKRKTCFLLSIHKPCLLEIQAKLVETTQKQKQKNNVFQTSLNMARSR